MKTSEPRNVLFRHGWRKDDLRWRAWTLLFYKINRADKRKTAIAFHQDERFRRHVSKLF